MSDENNLIIDGDYDDDAEIEVSIKYDIASYPSDLTLTVLHDMWSRGDIIIPDYQRNYVWNKKQASLLVESFLIGLPVPQIFLYVNEENKYEVIDGQQRITSIIYFFEGLFGEESLHGKRQVFRLSNLDDDSPFIKKKYDELDDVSRRKFDGAILRAINIKQLNPKGENTSVYHIFERLNTGGTPLKAQEIRNVVYRGKFIDALKKLNKNKTWRYLLGKKTIDKYQKDVELVLRLFSLVYHFGDYSKPMKEFLNKGMVRHQRGNTKQVKEFITKFVTVIEYIEKHMGTEKPFHLRGPLNIPALESIFVTQYNAKIKIKNLSVKANKLFNTEKFLELSQVSTSDKAVIDDRLNLAKKILIGN